MEIVSKPGRSVICCDDPTIGKSGFCDQMLHDLIIFVGVDAQMGRPGFAVVHARREYPLLASVTCHAVDNCVRIRIMPRAVNAGISGILAGNKRKGAADPILSADHIQLLFPDIRPKGLFPGAAGSPLGRISMGCHKATGAGVNFQNFR